MSEDSTRIKRLQRARQRQPWTVELLINSATDPIEFKNRTPVCAACPQPCKAEEVCATAVGKAGNLFESMGRDQVYYLIENGMKRLRTRDDATLRTVERERPNTFIALDVERTAETEINTNDRKYNKNEE
jgi:hypothetical protein